MANRPNQGSWKHENFVLCHSSSLLSKMPLGNFKATAVAYWAQLNLKQQFPPLQMIITCLAQLNLTKMYTWSWRGFNDQESGAAKAGLLAMVLKWYLLGGEKFHEWSGRLGVSMRHEVCKAKCQWQRKQGRERDISCATGNLFYSLELISCILSVCRITYFCMLMFLPRILAMCYIDMLSLLSDIKEGCLAFYKPCLTLCI